LKLNDRADCEYHSLLRDAVLWTLLASDEQEFLALVHSVIHELIRQGGLIAASSNAPPLSAAAPPPSLVGTGIAGLLVLFEMLRLVSISPSATIAAVLAAHPWMLPHFVKNVLHSARHWLELHSPSDLQGEADEQRQAVGIAASPVPSPCSCCSRGAGSQREFFGGVVVLFLEAARLLRETQATRMHENHFQSPSLVELADEQADEAELEAQLAILLLSFAKRYNELAKSSTISSVVDVQLTSRLLSEQLALLYDTPTKQALVGVLHSGSESRAENS